MEHLLKDGGDLDSMDRSLLDYGQNKAGLLNQQNGHTLDAPVQTPALSATTVSPPQQQQATTSSDIRHVTPKRRLAPQK